MYKVHFICGDKLLLNMYLEHIPSIGDEIRVSAGVFYAVVNRIFCLDEKDHTGATRVNIGMELINTTGVMCRKT